MKTKQIKIKYTVDATSGKIFNNLRNKENEKETKEKDEDDIINNNIKTIQRSVRGYLKRRKYRRMKKAANCLIKRLTSAISHPHPLAIRFLRLALIKSGFLRSCSVIE